MIHQEFKKQLLRKSDGTYQARLPWKEGHDFLPDNKSGSPAGLHNQLSKLKQVPDHLQEYHYIIKERLSSGILEHTPGKPDGKRVFYMSHRAVIKTAAETTKMRIVFDASAK